MDVYHYLYLSRFTGRVGDTGLRDILQRSRDQNIRLSVTGALLFDGERFVQLLEGPRAVVSALSERIRLDLRHRDFTPLYEGSPQPPTRRCNQWMSGYADPDAVAKFESRVTGVGNVACAVDHFLDLLAVSDVA